MRFRSFRLAVFSFLAGMSAMAGSAAAQVPGLWTPFNALWLPAPGEGHGLALRIQALSEPTALLGFGSAGVSVLPGTQIQDITDLSFDTYFESGGCGGGSPRVSLAVDTDGDGASNGNVFVYAGTLPNFDGCATGTWIFHDLLDGQPRFDSTQLGGPFYGTQAQAQAAAGASHQVLSASFVWDSTWLFGPSVLWLDNLQIDCALLEEPSGHVTSILDCS